MSVTASLLESNLSDRHKDLLESMMLSILSSADERRQRAQLDEDDEAQPFYSDSAPEISTASAQTLGQRRVRFSLPGGQPASDSPPRGSPQSSEIYENAQNATDTETLTATNGEADTAQGDSTSGGSTAHNDTARKASPPPSQDAKADGNTYDSSKDRSSFAQSHRRHSRSNASWTFRFSIDSNRSSNRRGDSDSEDRSRRVRAVPSASGTSQQTSAYGDSAYSSMRTAAPYLIGAGAAFLLSNRSAITSGLSAWTSAR